jgi:hypothetical protein
MLRYSPVTAAISHAGREKKRAVHLGQRRSAVGLISMADYECVLHAVYDRDAAVATVHDPVEHGKDVLPGLTRMIDASETSN